MLNFGRLNLPDDTDTNQLYDFSPQFPFIPFIGLHNSWRQDMSVSLSTAVTFRYWLQQMFVSTSDLDEKKNLIRSTLQ